MNSLLIQFEVALESITPPLAVPVSGGADSLALLLMAHKWVQKKGGRLVALTVDHGLRPESAQEAQQVHGWAEEKGIEHHILEWTGEKPTSRISEKARDVRYQLLMSWCQEHHIPTLLLGHHAQDQEETFWLRLASGSGLEGLTGMKKKSLRDGILILRPLLTASKDQLKAFLKSQNQPWIEDSSNENKKFFRGRLRPFLRDEGLSSERLLGVQSKLQEDADFIQTCLHLTLEKILEVHLEGFLSLQKNKWEELHPALLKRVLSVCLRWFSGSFYPPRSRQLVEVMNKIKTGLPFTSGGIYWFHQKDRIYLSRELSAAQAPLLLDNLHQEILWDQRFWVDPEIRGYVPEGTYLQCSGVALEQFSRKATAIPLYRSTSQLPPRRILPTLPALWLKGEVVAIPHLCYSILDNEVDLKKIFKLKPIFHNSLRFTI
jgi:tRNA(Ile)-lysidine synthase